MHEMKGYDKREVDQPTYSPLPNRFASRMIAGRGEKSDIWNISALICPINPPKEPHHITVLELNYDVWRVLFGYTVDFPKDHQHS